MINTCEDCKQEFDDEFRDTSCPHAPFLANDGKNSFTLHGESVGPKQTKVSGVCPDHPDVEPAVGFGLAGGGFGAYSYCPECGIMLTKSQEET